MLKLLYEINISEVKFEVRNEVVVVQDVIFFQENKSIFATIATIGEFIFNPLYIIYF